MSILFIVRKIYAPRWILHLNETNETNEKVEQEEKKNKKKKIIVSCERKKKYILETGSERSEIYTGIIFSLPPPPPLSIGARL